MNIDWEIGFYIFVIVSSLIMTIVFLLNAQYFQQIYINGSEDISSTRSSQLALVNWIVSFLLFILFIVSVFYTYKLCFLK